VELLLPTNAILLSWRIKRLGGYTVDKSSRYYWEKLRSSLELSATIYSCNIHMALKTITIAAAGDY